MQRTPADFINRQLQLSLRQMSENSQLLSAKIDVGTLQDVLTPISVLVDECKINLDQNELEIRAVDPANVCMVDVTIQSSGFEEYSAQRSVIGVDLDRFQDIIKMGGSGSEVHLVADKDTQTLQIEVENVSYTLALIDPDSIRDGPDIPNIDLDAQVEIEGSHISQGIKAAGMVSDHVELSFESDSEEFAVGAEGDTDDVEVAHGEDRVEDITVPDDAGSIYSLEYLEKVSKAISSSENIELSMDSEKPVRMEFDFADGNGRVIYMLAPRIQNS